MPLLNNNPTKTTAWKKLAAHFEEMSSFSLEKAFRENPNRKDDFSICMDDLTVDFSKNRIQQRKLKCDSARRGQCATPQGLKLQRSKGRNYKLVFSCIIVYHG